MELGDDFDMQDANDGGEPVDNEDDFYSGGEEEDAAGFDFVDNDSDDSKDTALYRHQQNYTILSENDIRQHQADDVLTISTVLSIPKVAASILLRYYNWNVGKVHDEWFADEKKVRRAVGLLEKPVVEYTNARELTCGICFETYPRDKMHAAACGHPFCSSCWAGLSFKCIVVACHCAKKMKRFCLPCMCGQSESFVHELRKYMSFSLLPF